MTYARPLTILAILAVSAGSIYAYNIKTPEERIIESIRIQNQAIEEANSAKIDSYRAILDKCYKSATGSSREILEKLDACKETQKPELQMIISYSGSIEWVSKGNNNVEESTASGSVIPEAPSQSKTVSVECEFWEIQKVEWIEYHYTATDEETTLQAIKNSHISKGMEHIGYHYVIKKDWEITETRNEKCVAWADKWSKNNYRFIQIAFVWDDKPTKEQTESILNITKDIQKRYKLSIDSVSAHSEWWPKSKKESLDYWFWSKTEFIKMIRSKYFISIYWKESPELQYMWEAWWDKDFIGTIFQESRMNNDTVWDGGNSIGYCQIHKWYQPGWYSEYLKLKTMAERLNYCHEKYSYSQSLKGWVWSRFHGYLVKDKHIKNINLK